MLAPRAGRGARDLPARSDHEGRRRDEVDAVRPGEVPGRATRHAGVAVLPDDPGRVRVDDDHAVVEVVVDEEVSVGERQRERGPLERRRARGRPVAPVQAAVTVEGLEDPGALPAYGDV